MSLVTVRQVNDALSLDLQESGSPPTFVDERLANVELKIKQAEDAIIDYLKKPNHGWTEATVPGNVSAAIILAAGSLLDDSKAELLNGLSTGELSNPLVGLLHRLRDPALA